MTPTPENPRGYDDILSGEGDLPRSVNVLKDDVSQDVEVLRLQNIESAKIVATSSTSNTIGTGSKTFIVETGRTFLNGTPRVRISYRLDHTKWVEGIVTSYENGGAPGELIVLVDRVGVGGTFNDWIVGVAGEPPSTTPLYLPNVSATPAAPASGAIIFAQNNVVKIIVPGGNITTIAS